MVCFFSLLLMAEIYTKMGPLSVFFFFPLCSLVLVLSFGLFGLA